MLIEAVLRWYLCWRLQVVEGLQGLTRESARIVGSHILPDSSVRGGVDSFNGPGRSPTSGSSPPHPRPYSTWRCANPCTGQFLKQDCSTYVGGFFRSTALHKSLDSVLKMHQFARK
ncbi:hypothetical protein IG631_17627 [Alternaria alternata]|nr:hypothetical protein IG631_17627 [Alternaria alternata]